MHACFLLARRGFEFDSRLADDLPVLLRGFNFNLQLSLVDLCYSDVGGAEDATGRTAQTILSMPRRRHCRRTPGGLTETRALGSSLGACLDLQSQELGETMPLSKDTLRPACF